MKKFLFYFLLSLTIIAINSCSFFDSLFNSHDESISITNLFLGKNELSISVNELTYLSVEIKPYDVQKLVNLVWTYDDSIISIDTSSSWGVTITGKKEGQTNLKCSYDGFEATCIISVLGIETDHKETVEPYIYSNSSIIQSKPGVTEKIFCSLYGGGIEDINEFTWTCDNPNVVAFETNGQYCLITTKDTGYARLKVTHPKATYPYYIGVYCFQDNLSIPYITTTNNVVTLNLDDVEKNISVSLVNGSSTYNDNLFTYETIINNIDDLPVEIVTTNNKVNLKPLKSGYCTIRVTHPDSNYPLDILCRVISVIKNVYIQPSKTVLTLSGNSEQVITATLENIDISEYNIDNFSYSIDDESIAEIVSWVGNEVYIKGKNNGSCKLSISHEKAAYSREVLLISNNQITNAIDTSCYISTSQNYFNLKTGTESFPINITLKGGGDGDETNFLWSIKNSPKDGSSNDVISLTTVNGTSNNASRLAYQSYCDGKAFVTAQNEGTAVITITHPKAYYPLEILIKVSSQDSIQTESLYFTGESVVRILNGEETTYTIQLNGNKSASDDNNITWTCDNPNITLSPIANTIYLKAPATGTGNTISYLTINHNKVETPKKVLILTANTSEELLNMKAFYSNQLYYNLDIDEVATCNTSYIGFADDFDFNSAIWTVNNPSVCSVVKNTNPLTATIKGLKAGTSTVTVSINDNNKTYICTYYVTFYSNRSTQINPDIYFTTNRNVINLLKVGDNSTVHISAINLHTSQYQNILWSSNNENIKIVSNGDNATIIGLQEGESVLTITHPESQNTLTIYIKIGSEYIISETKPIVYISSTDVITFLKDDPVKKLEAVLVNYSNNNSSSFSFTVDNSNIVEIISQSITGYAFLKPKESGQAEITITNDNSSISKKVLILVGNTAEELRSNNYLTTNSNIVTIGEGNTKTISVMVNSLDNTIIDGYTWTSSAPDVVNVNGQDSSAILTANSIGTAVITITNKNCTYPLKIIAQVVNPIAAANNPYIQLTASVLTLNINDSYQTITADLIGGTKDDFKNFYWEVSDSSICTCYGQNEIGKIKALKEGTAVITVTHPKTAYSAQILIVCDKIEEKSCQISVPSNIIYLKPTDSVQTIVADLINGNDTDKYNFTWSLDVYDIIDFVYSANVCTIEPKQQGQVNITIQHPKAAYDQHIVVKVQEYNEFSFPDNYITIKQGISEFLTMQIPITKVSTFVEYSVDNAKVCSVTGTKNTVQITGITAGTTTVKAKLKATSTGIVQGSAEMMVCIQESNTNDCYISSSSSIYTIQKGKSQTLNATILGDNILTNDQKNLTWTTTDTDIIKITGISANGSITGQSIYITAIKSGEALITCSHDKANSDLQFFIIVPGDKEKSVTLEKNYINILKGSSGTSLSATINNLENSNDYNELVWTISSSKDTEICRILGSGKTITLLPLNIGVAELMVSLPNTDSSAKCTINIQANKSFSIESSSISVLPTRNVTLEYTVSPPTANITWTANQSDDFFTYNDLGHNNMGEGKIQINGIKEGSGNLYGITDDNLKVNLSIRCVWEYSFNINKNIIKTEPRINGRPDDFVISFDITPSDNFEIETVLTNDIADVLVDNGQRKIIITPKKEGNAILYINAFNTNNNTKTEFPNLKKAVNLIFSYDHITIVPVINTINGNFSRWSSEDNTLYIGDGESIDMNFTISEPNVDYTIDSFSFLNTNIVDDISITGNQITNRVLTHPKDYQELGYLITTGYNIYDKENLQRDPYATTWKWYHSSTKEQYYAGWFVHCDCFYYTTGNFPVCRINNKGELDDSKIKLVKDSTQDNTWVSKDKFENSYWYIPYASCTGHETEQDWLLGAEEKASEGAGKHFVEEKFLIPCEISANPDTTIKSSTNGKIVISIKHNDRTETLEIPVICEIRNCASK